MDSSSKFCTPSPSTLRVGIDIGGTFTDVVLLDGDGGYLVRKVLSTPDDFGGAITQVLQELIEAKTLRPGDVNELIHGTTIATNAILEMKGARTALITTEGFRDVLEIGRMRMPRMYDMAYEKPPPLIPRRRRLEVRERMTHKGEALIPLSEEDAEAAADRLSSMDVESLAICLLHAYANPAHEELLAEVLHRRLPDLPISLSSQILPEIREYERTSTTAVNAYVLPSVRRYLLSLESRLRALGIGTPLLMMQSSGGVVSASRAAERPFQIIESGPAAGVVAAASLARRIGIGNLITLDMGGTTAKAALIENGEPGFSPEYEVGGGVSQASSLIKGGGYLVRAPSLDIAEVGAGGGSIAWIDPGGALQVGPHSAGADPGPICYGRRGTRPTLTDANLLLGYLSPKRLAGHTLPLDVAAAHKIFEETIARAVGLDLLHAAYGVHVIATARMMRAVKAVSTERGRDPRQSVLCAFGGNGGVHAVGLARELGIKEVLIPHAPGIFSALGLLFSELASDWVQSFIRPLTGLSLVEIRELVESIEKRATTTLSVEMAGRLDAIDFLWFADLRFRGQSHELRVPFFIPASGLPADFAEQLTNAFVEEHRRTYGHASLGQPIELVNIRLRARVTGRDARLPGSLRRHEVEVTGSGHASAPSSRTAYFGPDVGEVETPVLGRGHLEGELIDGPVIIEEYDATTLVPPDCRAWLDDVGNIRIEV